jgi:hypothetical protein
MLELRFQYVTADGHFLVFAPSGRVYRLRPHEFEFALLQAERLLGAGTDELILEAPGVMRLRLSGCSRETHERTARIMRETWRYHEDEALRRYGGPSERGGPPEAR